MALLQAGTVLVFGIDTPEELYGLVQAYSIKDTVSRAMAKSPNGAITSIQESTQTKLLDLTYILLTISVEPPEIGSVFTFDSLEWHIDDVTDGLVVDGFETFTVKATYYPQLGS